MEVHASKPPPISLLSSSEASREKHFRVKELNKKASILSRMIYQDL